MRNVTDYINFPVWAITAYEYNDYSALTPEDEEAVQTFEDKMGKNILDLTYSQERYFCHSPEFGLPCECIEARIFTEAG